MEIPGSKTTQSIKSSTVTVGITRTGDTVIDGKPVNPEQLKARLSEYLRIVRGGETVLVTDREEVVAEIRPARRQPIAVESASEALDLLAERGEVGRAGCSRYWDRRSGSVRQRQLGYPGQWN